MPQTFGIPRGGARRPQSLLSPHQESVACPTGERPETLGLASEPPVLSLGELAETVEPQPRSQEIVEQCLQEEALQPYREEQTSRQVGQFQPQYEEMLVPYPREMPPIEQWLD